MPGKSCGKGGHRAHTPITSEAQRGAMGAAYSALKGETPMSELGGPAREMAKTMPQAELKSHLQEAGDKNLPAKKRGVKGNTFYASKLLSGD